METLILAAFESLNSGSSGIFTSLLSLAVLGLGGYLFLRKTEIEEVTSAGALHTQQIESLMQQVKLLSEELTMARTQLKEIHEQNIALMQQVRDSALRIQELEDLLSRK